MDTNFFNVLKTAKKKGVSISSIICHYDPIEQKEIKFLHEIPIVGI
jgi:hypothetical protein